MTGRFSAAVIAGLLALALSAAAVARDVGAIAPVAAGKAAPVVVPAHHLPSRREAASAVLACGMPKRSISVRYERSMDEDVVWVARDAGALSEKALQCIAQASLKTDYDVYFRDARTQKRYDPLYWHLNMASEIASARQWLRERGLLATLPLPQAGKPLAAYAEAVEVFCGIEKRALLVAVDEHTITYTKGGLGHLTSRGVEGGAANDEQFSCVMNATSAVNLESHGFFFGFVGNAAAVRPTP